MLRNLGMIATVLLTSQLLAIVQQCAGLNSATSWLCKENTKVAFRVGDNQSTCHCVFYPDIESPDYGDDYEYIEGIGAYKFYNEPKTWNEARKTCVKDGAQLAVLDTENEKKALADLYRTKSSSIKEGIRAHFWLGIQDEFMEGDWATSDGRPLKYAPWSQWKSGCWKQPDNGKGLRPAQNCGSFSIDCDGMDDINCYGSTTFFCEKPYPCP